MPRPGEAWRDPCFDCGRFTDDQRATKTSGRRITLCADCVARRHEEYLERVARRGETATFSGYALRPRAVAEKRQGGSGR